MDVVYQDKCITLIHGDVMTVAASLPIKGFDLIMADPPYGETTLKWDIKLDGWQRRCLPLLKRHGSLWCFGSMQFFLNSVHEFLGWERVQEIVWEKHNGKLRALSVRMAAAFTPG